jgi:hypothetical protein
MRMRIAERELRSGSRNSVTRNFCFAFENASFRTTRSHEASKNHLPKK